MALDLHIGASPAPPAPADPDTGEAYLKEYYFVQDLLNKQSADCLEVKKWSVTAASAVAVLGSVAGAQPAAEALVIAVLALGFWLTETTTRVTQWSFVRVICQLEHDHPHGPRVSHRWSNTYMGRPANDADGCADTPAGQAGERSRFFRHMFRRSTLLPHAVVMAASLAMFAAALGGAFRRPTDHGPKPLPLSGAVTVTLAPSAGGTAPAPLTGPR